MLCRYVTGIGNEGEMILHPDEFLYSGATIGTEDLESNAWTSEGRFSIGSPSFSSSSHSNSPIPLWLRRAQRMQRTSYVGWLIRGGMSLSPEGRGQAMKEAHIPSPFLTQTTRKKVGPSRRVWNLSTRAWLHQEARR